MRWLCCLSHTLEDRLVVVNGAARPGKFVKLPRPGETADILTLEEADVLLESTEKHYPDLYPLVFTLLRTPLRKGEIRGLQWGDVDDHGQFLEIRRAFSKKDLSAPKSGKPRQVHMSDKLRTVLRRHKRLMEVKALREGKELPEWIFPAQNLEDPLDDSMVNRYLNRCCDKAGIRRIRVHDTRHTAASWHLAQGASPVYVKEQLGHSTIKLTVDTYGHGVASLDRSAVNALDDPEKRKNPQPNRNQEQNQ